MTTRPLTLSETALATSMFVDAIDLGGVRIHRTVWWPFQPRETLMAPDGDIWCHPQGKLYRACYASADLRMQSLFIHEMTHVWQAQSGVNLILAKIAAGDGNRAYAYDLSAPCGFEGLNIEQQAMIVQDAYLARHGAETPFETHVYSEVLANWPGSIFSNPHPV